MSRSWVHGVAFVLSAIAVLSVAVALQALSQLGARTFDLTETRRLTLSAYARSVLGELSAPLEIDYYYRRGERLRARDLLELVAAESRWVRFDLIDIDRNPVRARENGVRRFDRAVLRYDGQEKVTPAATEQALVTGIAELLRGSRPVLYLVRGHGERTTRVGHRDQLGRWAQLLRGDGYVLRPLPLLSSGGVPNDAAAVVIVGPETDFAETELVHLTGYLERGGAVLALVDPRSLPGLEQWLAGYGFELADDVVLDGAGRVYGSDGTNVVVPIFRDHPATSGLESPAVLGRARAVGARAASMAEIVGRTSAESFLARGAARTRTGDVQFREETDRPGPVGVMAVATTAAGGRLAVVGDADLASDDFVTLLGNRDLLAGLLGWLTDRETAGARVAPEVEELSALSPVFVSDRVARALFWFVVGIQPVLVLCLGVLVVVRRARS